MTLNKSNVRQSLFSTPQGNRKSSTSSRRSLSQMDLNEANETLFSTVMNDPLKKRLLMQYLTNHKNGDKDILELVQKKEKEHVTNGAQFSPMSVYRRRIFAAPHPTDGPSVTNPLKKAYPQTAIPFNKLLVGVVAYVQIISKGQDRSAGVKALLKAMGGRISENIRRGITHAIIKDVPYETYKKANMVKAHLVSVLWLEAVRKNHYKVPEKHYPALGPEAYTSNVSLLCEELQKDYAEVVKDELECSRNLEEKIKQNLSNCFNEDVVNTSLPNGTECSMSGVGRISQTSSDKLANLSSDKEVFSNGNTSSNDMPSPVKKSRKSSVKKKQIATRRSRRIAHSFESDLSDLEVSNTSNSCQNKIKNDSINLHVLNAEPVGVSKSQQSLRISRRSSKLNSTDSSALSSLRVSTDFNKSKNAVCASEPIESLRISSTSSIQRMSRLLRNSTASNNSKKEDGASESIESLRISTDFNKSKTEAAASESIESLRISTDFNKPEKESSESIESLRISTDFNKPGKEAAASESIESLRISTDYNKSKKDAAASETIESLRLSSSNSKRRTTESNSLSPSRVSMDSDKSNDYDSNASESRRSLRKSTRRLKGRKTTSFEKDTTNKENDGSECNENDVITPNELKLKDPFENITQRKKRPTRLNFSSSDDNSCPEDKKVENQPKVLRKRKLYDPNDNYVSQWKQIDKDQSKNVEIAPILMTPSAKKLFDKNFNNASDSTDEKSKKSPAQKAQTVQENVFKTPGKPVNTKKVQSEKKTKRDAICLEDNVKFSQKNRRSTMEFLPKESFKSPRKTTPMKPRKLTSIVCSRFHTKEVQTFTQIVRKLGVFLIEDEVTEKTSHLVLAEPKRTINVLRAMAKGCWVLKSEWLYRSLEAGKWLPEENYEMIEFSPAVQKSRQERQAFGRYYAMDVFSDCGKIYIAKSSSPRCSDLQDLVKICKGKLTTIQRNADVVVGEYVAGTAKCVAENWILDCIQFYKSQSFKSYLLNSAS